MFELALSLPLLVATPAIATPVYNISNVAFNPLAYTTPENLAAREVSYADVKAQVLSSNVTIENVKFGPAADHFVNPVFGVEGLN
jgi:hypothetical protein